MTGTPLQNSLNDIVSLIRFIRLEPFLDRHVWNQYVGVLAQKGDALGAERLKVIMRHLALRRTKDTKDASGKPILSLPPIDSKLIKLDFSETERAFYSHHHARYKHDFAKLEETDSVMKNFCSILQELLKLRQICVHPALLQDSQDRAAAAGEGGGDLVATIEKHGITKPRAVQLLSLMLDAGGGGCLECGYEMPAFARAEGEEGFADEENGGAACGKSGRKPPKKARKANKSQSAPTSAATSDDDSGAPPADDDIPYIVTRCQHTFCPRCFRQQMSHNWPQVKSDDKTQCRVCQTEFQPAVDAVEVHPREYARVMAQASDQIKPAKGKGKKPATRLFEHSTKTRWVRSLGLCPCRGPALTFLISSAKAICWLISFLSRWSTLRRTTTIRITIPRRRPQKPVGRSVSNPSKVKSSSRSYSRSGRLCSTASETLSRTSIFAMIVSMAR